MKLTRMYTGADGESHFEELEIAFEETGGSSRSSKLREASGIMFREMGGDYFLDWHNAPRRQFIINLEGAEEIEVGGGTKRRFGPGEILLAEDTTGRGHISRAVDGQPRRSVFVTLE